MVVDDDGVCLAAVSKGLRKRGFEVVGYADPREAMRRLEQDQPAAVITDMRMPHMSGLEVVQEVKARLGSSAPPVLVVSVDDDERLLEDSFRLGATDYLLKPINEVELGVKLEKALRPTGQSRLSEPVPERIGAWQLIDCIGRGGTACVFTASREGEEQLYAVKVVWPHLTRNTETLLRFRREIDLLADLSHPRLVRFLESGREGEFYYYVMDYLPGGTLRTRIRRQGPRPWSEALKLLEDVSQPLGYLHERGLVHRDVKPGNLFFDRDDQAVLGDFGLTRRMSDRGITLSEEFIGTPLYLAPEVFGSADFDHTVDFYALGVCAEEMLLGRPPLDEGDSVRVIGRIIDEGLPSPQELLPDLPRPVLDLLARLVSRQRDERPRDAAALRQAVAAARRAADAGPGTAGG